MGALSLGPLVLSLDRAYAALGFAVLLLGAEWLARRGRPELAAWGWQAALAAFLGARAGFVLDNLEYYLGAPGAVVAIWQGGFAPWWGVAAAALLSLAHAWRAPRLRRPVVSLGLLALAAWWLPTTLLTPAAATGAVTLPPLELETLGGHAVHLASLGAPVVVNVWATWCPPCRRELPLLVEAAATTPDVRILLVNQREDPQVVRSYLAAAGLPPDGTVLDRSGALGSALRVAGLPTTFAFDARGTLVDVHVGEISPPALRAMIASLREAP
jgi:cytochrome c biogenesis protein CcmG, thiol:disulfide interchange protein DsbE